MKTRLKYLIGLLVIAVSFSITSVTLGKNKVKAANPQVLTQTYEIYEKAHRCKKVYDSFQIFGSLLRAETMEEISSANLFPEAEHLLMLERIISLINRIN